MYASNMVRKNRSGTTVSRNSTPAKSRSRSRTFGDRDDANQNIIPDFVLEFELKRTLNAKQTCCHDPNFDEIKV